ncbi:hypothetical protein Hanom_Chr09g00843951 [Helianthus anomalus]
MKALAKASSSIGVHLPPHRRRVRVVERVASGSVGVERVVSGSVGNYKHPATSFVEWLDFERIERIGLASVGMMQTHLMNIARIGSVLPSDSMPEPRKHWIGSGSWDCSGYSGC